MVMFQKLYEDGFLQVEKMLIQEYQKLGLTYPELTILLFLLDFSKKRVFSSNALAKKAGITKKEVEHILEQLMSKNFFDLSQETKNHKIIEVFSLHPTFAKLEKIYQDQIRESKRQNQLTLIQQTIEYLEHNKGQTLTSNELDLVRNWYQDQEFSHEEIKNTIEEALCVKKTSVFYINTLLGKKKFLTVIPDEKADKALAKLFKKIK
ncbi:hypothetical protein HPP_3910 [Hydrangea phyllody phytoplasma]|uniref:Chromosome replication initiation protein n=4 Tax=16SrI (Aster yellows group) TaxID=3042590 RepID=B9X0Y8_9MOLU|nr:DnaD domain protein [Hydrangea phyllody phytoplasma]BAH24223.1 chromosome replication initiation protein [Mulberry dwarf phytoplasma]BAH24235.1 chromosome replication initiation protein [Porcelain vine witches'-broom phytoplasma]GLH61444.1 hypothetical protein RHYP_3900 [Rhus yellows phytoplasma]GFZ75433.1 hypothetical protein HPP_3910 [Hydrangea phyllody phytoplasma]GLH61899.1 hypothetical protein HP2P_3060 [Hydrangea phyllody phytoplasma]